jgi:ketosteroid isomerase-like protein
LFGGRLACSVAVGRLRASECGEHSVLSNMEEVAEMPGEGLTARELSNMVDQYHGATAEFIKGNPQPYKQLFSQRDDVTLGNPFGPIGHGREEVSQIMDRAAALYRDGELTGFENVSTYVTRELAYIVEVEHFSVKIDGSRQFSEVVLRTTTIFRPERGQWRIVHRHADPIAAARPPESVIQN